MQEALGLRPVTERRGVAALEAGELKALLARSAPAEDEGRVTGLGYSKLGLEQSEGGQRETLPGLGPAPAPPPPPLVGAKRPAEREESREERRERKAARKEAKKEAWHERKHERREQREERR